MNRYAQLNMKPQTRETIANSIFGRKLTRPIAAGVMTLFKQQETGRSMTSIRDLLNQGPWQEDQLQGVAGFGLSGFGAMTAYPLFGNYGFENSLSLDDFTGDSYAAAVAQANLDWAPPSASAVKNAEDGYTRLSLANDSGTNPAAESKFAALDAKTKAAIKKLDTLSAIGHQGQVITTGRGWAVEGQRVNTMKVIKGLMGEWARVTIPAAIGTQSSDSSASGGNTGGGATNFDPNYVPAGSKNPYAFPSPGGGSRDKNSGAATAASTPIWENPLVIGGAVLALGVGALLLFKKK